MGIIGIGTAVALVATTIGALQSVEVGGTIRIRGRYWKGGFVGEPFMPMAPAFTAGRPLGPFGLTSHYSWDRGTAHRAYFEQGTFVHVDAQFTDAVRAYIELHDFGIWGEDFRSDYRTGIDQRPSAGANSLALHQSFVEVDDLWGAPVRLRAGRQELKFGKGWLVSNRVSPTFGISFDGVRLTYHPGGVTLDAWWSKLTETFSAEEDGDVDFMGVYGTYEGWEAVAVSLYWLLVRDARAIADSRAGPLQEGLEGVLGLDDYDPTYLHTVGLRVFGGRGPWDYDLEAAYQFGEADAVGRFFTGRLYGDNEARFDAAAVDAEAGYTFDTPMHLRIFVGGAWLEGEDNRDVALLDFYNPRYRPEASLSFNRLFSSTCYSAIFDICGGAQALSNFYQVRAGLSFQPAEAVTLGAKAAYFWVDEPFERPALLDAGPYRIATALPFGPTTESEDDIGLLTHLWLKYDYTENLFFKAGWEHLFAREGITGGNYLFKNALEFSGGPGDEDADYFYFDTGITF